MRERARSGSKSRLPLSCARRSTALYKAAYKAALYTEEMAADLKLVGLAVRADPKPIDKVVDGLKFYIKRLARRRR